MKIKGIVKNFKKIVLMIMIKILLGISLELLWAVWSQFSFRWFLFPLVLLKVSIGPFQCFVDVYYRVLICCTCHFQSHFHLFIYFGFLFVSLFSV